MKYEGFKELLGRLRHPTLPLHMIQQIQSERTTGLLNISLTMIERSGLYWMIKSFMKSG